MLTHPSLIAKRLLTSLIKMAKYVELAHAYDRIYVTFLVLIPKN